jgi:guanylate kinase
MKTLIAIFGKSGSGKDSIARKLCEKYNYHKVKRITTRPMREGESQGDPYYFVSDMELQNDLTENLGSYLEVGYFNNWMYATHEDALEKDINIGTYDVDAVDILLQDKQVNVIPFFIYVDDKERMIRLLNRQENPDIDEICRRYVADKESYRDIGFEYYFIENKDLDKAVEEIKNIVNEELDNII